MLRNTFSLIVALLGRIALNGQKNVRIMQGFMFQSTQAPLRQLELTNLLKVDM